MKQLNSSHQDNSLQQHQPQRLLEKHQRHRRHRRTNTTSRTTAEIDDNNSANIFLPDAWASLTQNIQMQSINCYQHLSTQYIDQLVDIEMKRLKANCRCEEDHYVEQMLLENPIVVERRSSSQPSTATQSAPQTPIAGAAVVAAATPKTNGNYPVHLTGNGCSHMSPKDNSEWTNAAVAAAATPQKRLLQLRADSCRRSRINNKIKKAKMKYRHKFMSDKLTQSVGMLECIQNLIAQAEAQLMRQGCNVQRVNELRSIFCID